MPYIDDFSRIITNYILKTFEHNYGVFSSYRGAPSDEKL